MQSGFEWVAGESKDGIRAKNQSILILIILLASSKLPNFKIQLSYQYKSVVCGLGHFRRMALINKVKGARTVTELSMY